MRLCLNISTKQVLEVQKFQKHYLTGLCRRSRRGTGIVSAVRKSDSIAGRDMLQRLCGGDGGGDGGGGVGLSISELSP